MSVVGRELPVRSAPKAVTHKHEPFVGFSDYRGTVASSAEMQVIALLRKLDGNRTFEIFS